MNTTNFTYLLANPQKITSQDLEELEDVIKKYPYFQSARALQLKGLKNQNSFLYNDALKLAAAHTTDRDILFEYITSERFIQNEISQNILHHDSSVSEIKVISEDISEEVSNENDKAEMKKAEDILNPELFQRKFQSVTKLFEKKEEEPEKILQPDKPLEFRKDDTYSFSEWLKLTKAKPIERSEESEALESEKSDQEIIDKKDNSTETLKQEDISNEVPPSEKPRSRKMNVSSDISSEDSAKQEISAKQKAKPIGQASSTKEETIATERAVSAQDEHSTKEEALAEEEKERKFQLIERFIQDRPKIIPSETPSKTFKKNIDSQRDKNLVEAFAQSSDSLMTETLAKVYLQQKNYKKAIQAYKILILKNPEKSGFFADQIRAIEKLIKSEQS